MVFKVKTDLHGSGNVQFLYNEHQRLQLQFVLFVKNLAEENNVKVIVPTLGRWEDRQYSEHHEVNDCLKHFMMRHKVDSAGVVIAT